jgi:hypothetical protein
VSYWCICLPTCPLPYPAHPYPYMPLRNLCFPSDMPILPVGMSASFISACAELKVFTSHPSLHMKDHWLPPGCLYCTRRKHQHGFGVACTFALGTLNFSVESGHGWPAVPTACHSSLLEDSISLGLTVVTEKESYPCWLQCSASSVI